MNEAYLLEAIEQCTNGNVPFNLGRSRAFLYGNHWYPLRAVINYARQLAGEGELTTDRALVLLAYLGNNLRVQDINFNNTFPVKLTAAQIIAEANKLAQTLQRLVSQID